MPTNKPPAEPISDGSRRTPVDSRLPALETLLGRVKELAEADPQAWDRLRVAHEDGPQGATSIEGHLRELFLQLELVKRALQEGAGPDHDQTAGRPDPRSAEATIPKEDGPAFLAPWEARVFALVVLLNKQGHFTWPEWVHLFSREIEAAKAAGKPTHGPAYYALWVSSAEKLLISKGLLLDDEYSRTMSAFALDHPHSSIKGLMDEHRTIEKILDAFTDFSDRLEKSAGTPQELMGFVGFLTEFEQQIHHAKEEDLLFKAMVANGFPEDGAISVMKDEHAQGAAYLAALREAGQGVWDDSNRQATAQTIRRYVRLLRQHVTKEDRDLYPAAHAQLSHASLDELDRACGEHDVRHAADRSRLLAVAGDLSGH